MMTLSLLLLIDDIKSTIILNWILGDWCLFAAEASGEITASSDTRYRTYDYLCTTKNVHFTVDNSFVFCLRHATFCAKGSG